MCTVFADGPFSINDVDVIDRPARRKVNFLPV